MKAITAVCANGASAPTITNGRISRHRDGENDEIQMYLSKLKDLVPNMPKDKKLSKLEVIRNVINYICDLQRALETTSNSSAISSFDSSAVLCESFSPRQPLGVRSSPNTILVANTTSETNSKIKFKVPVFRFISFIAEKGWVVARLSFHIFVETTIQEINHFKIHRSEAPSRDSR
ncbi:Protein extra-macrochaetae [Pseudolycoriella hygida]|uniref:Protein extra-macrochaetae n=1 Tax=Pseudolycoriella hygida TaxID=35572 RepID=A0A9Q0MMJ9_9DIPT|nr:Protein extra-macrochaetae [Pseudolycoriella hygida]